MTRLREITIHPHDGSEPCVIELFVPELPGEPDVTVVGSANGVGKTMALEAAYRAAVDAGISVAYRRQCCIYAAQAVTLMPGDAEILAPWAQHPSGRPLRDGDTLHLSAGLVTYLQDMRMIRDTPGVSLFLFDLPETFLNAQMQRTWVHTATRLAPKAQFIIATHSEEIVAAVRPEARVILRNDKEPTP